MTIGKYDNMVNFGGHTKFTGVEKSPYIVVNGTASSLPSDYTDITSIDNFDTYCDILIGTSFGLKDEKAIQREIDILANIKCNNDVNTNWSNLTTSEQRNYCKWSTSKVSPINFGTTVPIASEREAMSYEYDRRNTMSRGTWRIDNKGFGRLEVIRIYLFSKIGATNALLLMNDAVNESLIKNYEDGIVSLASDGIVGLKDFLLSTTGTKYDGNTTMGGMDPGTYPTMDGLSLRTYPTIDGSGDTTNTVANVCASIMDGWY